MVKLNSRQIVEISDLLKQHTQKLPDGLIEYMHDMSDKKIAQLVGVSYWHVLNVRRSVYGDMHRGAKATGKESLQVQVDELRLRLAAIESFMQSDWGYELPQPQTQERTTDVLRTGKV